MAQTHWIYGVGICLTGQLIAEAQSADSDAQLTHATLVATIMNLGRMFGCIVSAQLTDRLGVLRVIQLGTPLSLLGWPLLTLTAGGSTMLAGAVLAGLFVGLNAFGGRLYIAEVSSARRRAVLCNLPNIAVGLSLLASFSLSAAIPWRYAVLLCACVPSVVHFFGALLLPNSPRWMLHHGASDDQARKALSFFRGRQTDVSFELKDIRQSLRGKPNLSVLRQARLIFTDWDVAKPCLLLLAQYAFEIFCGGIVLTQYAPGIFKMAVKSLSPTQCSQLLAAILVTALVCSARLLRWWGRRTVLMAAGLLNCAGMLTAAAFFYFETALGDHTWLVMFGILLANASSLGGISPLSHLYCGELLPLAVRQMFGNVISLYLGGLATAFIHLFAVMRQQLGMAGLFVTLAGVNVLQVLFAGCLLPETRGLSLEEVQRRHFSSSRKMAAADQAAQTADKPCGAGAGDQVTAPPAVRGGAGVETGTGRTVCGEVPATLTTRHESEECGQHRSGGH